MLLLLVAVAFAAEPAAAEPAVTTPPPAPPATEPVATTPAEGPGRPVFGIGAGLRGGYSTAGFVMSVRVRVTPWLAADPMVYVLTSTEVTTSTTTNPKDETIAETEEESTGESMTYAALALRLRLVEGRRASGWMLVTGNLLVQDLETVSTTHHTYDEEAAVPEEEVVDLSSGGLGAGFSGEVWLRPELTLSADAGFNLWESSWMSRRDDDTDYVWTSSDFKLTPFVQLALHLYL